MSPNTGIAVCSTAPIVVEASAASNSMPTIARLWRTSMSTRSDWMRVVRAVRTPPLRRCPVKGVRMRKIVSGR